MANVGIENVTKAYGAVQVIHGVSAEIVDGEFVILVGPSGCGKSTLLRMIAGLESINRGVIRIGDRVVNDLEPKDRDIAMVFQSYALYPQMTVAQNMGFALELKGVKRAQIDAKVNEAATILGLTPLLKRLPKQLSGGQRQRVAMGRAIVRDPQVFLFDEPLSNLDAKLRVAMRAEIKSLQKRLGTTTIYVTHDQIEAMTMADKIIVLKDGVIEQVGPPLELYDKPANIFVAGFIGSPSMNMINGTIDMQDGAGLVLASGLRVPIGSADSIRTGEKVVFGIRPEHIEIDPENGVEARIDVIEPTGSETHVLVSFGGEQLTCVFRDRLTAKEGETIPLSFARGPAHFFAPESGVRRTT